ncbi:MAG: NAD(P)/FAD-dependent oxidoreductase [Planctomycetes bacterium]|nr:NAD(P)/FAD-dependent oxidoreductase [Planctomycetota bacterium]
MNADAVIIGAGLSGLVDAILLAETGRRIIVIEQHAIPGGYLQQFRRGRTVFDVGFHYMGSTLPGRPMRQFLEHLQVWPRLRILPFPEDAAIEVISGPNRFAYPARFDRFHEKALAAWPGERAAIDRFVADVDGICSRFKWFALRRGVEYGSPLDLQWPGGSFADYIEGATEDAWLREALSLQTFNLGLLPSEAPWVKHALAFRSNFDRTSRIDGGGGALVKALLERGRELGVEYRFRSEVVGIACEGRMARAVTTANGERIDADLFVAACHPKVAVRCIPEESLPAIFRERILAMKDSRGAFQLFLALSAPLSSIGSTCVMIRGEEEAGDWPPLDVILVTYPCGEEKTPRGGPRLEAMAYMDWDIFASWGDRPSGRRGEDYERLKQEIARRMIARMRRIIPELPDAIAEAYTATPLTDAWYTRNEHGAVFGVSHDVEQQGTARPQPRMRLKNLYFTGHSITMPGICGVFINAFDTCEMIRGGDDLFRAVAT